MNFFELFQLKPQFKLDLNDLSERYHALQSATHPDRFTQASAQEKRLAMQLSTQINQAYQHLVDPSLRAIHLFEFFFPAASLTSYPLDPEFLEQIMIWQEGLLEDQNDPTILRAIDLQYRQVEQALEAFWQTPPNNEVDSITQAAQLTQQLQFLQKTKVGKQHNPI